MVEIWVPYGRVEVSFDIKQENLSQIIDSAPTKISQDDLEKRVDSITCDTLLVLSSTPGTQKVIETLLNRNKLVKTLLYPKEFGSFARRQAQESGIQAEPFDIENLVENETVEGSASMIFSQIKGAKRLAILSSAHYDPLFGLSGGSSDLVSLNPKLKSIAFEKSSDQLPCSISESNASLYSIHLLQTCPDVDVVQVIEKNGTLVEFYYGDPESVHLQTIETWKKLFRVTLNSRAERIIFGTGGMSNDKTLCDALSRSFFNVVQSLALANGAESKICMLAECSEGLGSDVFLNYVTGIFAPGAVTLTREKYSPGLEVLTSYFRINKELDLSMLSTLPRYFLQKFDFRPVRGARDAPSAVVSQGSRAKITVVPDASTCYFESSLT